jgi:hypothetical protein
MNAITRLSGVAVLAALLLFAPAGATAASTAVVVAGEAMQIMSVQLAGRTFQHDGPDIRGLSFPITLVCPGKIEVVWNPDFSIKDMKCDASTADGLQGVIVAVENVVRHDVGVAGATPKFEMEGDQMFSGWVLLDGRRHYGTLMLRMKFHGDLQNPDFDCFTTPEFVNCGAANFTGTWEVLPGSGSGNLRDLSGGGVISFSGGAFPAFTGNLVFTSRGRPLSRDEE